MRNIPVCDNSWNDIQIFVCLFQEKDIEHISTTVVGTTENIKLANDEIREVSFICLILNALKMALNCCFVFLIGMAFESDFVLTISGHEK